LTVNAGATYLQSEIQGTFCNYNPYGNDMNTAGAANPGCPAPPLPSDHGSENYSGDRIPLTPEIQSVVSIDYAFPLNENFRGFVGASASYRGETNAAFGNLPEFKVDAYTTVDLRAGVETEDGRWRLSIWGNNVTDEYYWTNVFHGADTNVRFTGLPAIYGATLTFRH
ncbi:MAG: hypothetical protein AB7L65_01265, partial [Hyphomonadaceae bacterium]